jgi:protein SCO1/2
MTSKYSFLLVLACVGSLTTLGCEKKSSIAKEYPAEVTQLATEGGKGLPYYVGKDLRPEWTLSQGLILRGLSSFQFKDQTNQVFGSDRLKGKVTIVSFFFTHCPGVCPMTMKNLIQNVQSKFLGEDRVSMVSFSITPDLDQPELLNKYAHENKIDSRRWRLLTGDSKEIYQLARESFNADTFSPGENKVKKISQKDFLHSESIYLLDQDLKLRGVYNGRMVASMRELVRDAESLLQ